MPQSDHFLGSTILKGVLTSLRSQTWQVNTFLRADTVEGSS